MENVEENWEVKGKLQLKRPGEIARILGQAPGERREVPLRALWRTGDFAIESFSYSVIQSLRHSQAAESASAKLTSTPDPTWPREPVHSLAFERTFAGGVVVSSKRPRLRKSL
jgi:hypothetical protein